MREDVQKVEDKIPILGDIPIIGRLFRSSVDQHLKRNLVIFVSARLMKPDGDPVRFDEEKEEVIEMLAPPDLGTFRSSSVHAKIGLCPSSASPAESPPESRRSPACCCVTSR